jgi:xanthine/uracil permease
MMPREDRSLGSLFSDLTHEFSLLVRKEVALAKAEIGEKAANLKASVTSLAIGGGVLFVAGLVLIAAVVLFVYKMMEGFEHAIWLAPLIVGAIIAAVGYFLLKAGLNKLSANSLTPERTVRSIKQDGQVVREHASFKGRENGASGATVVYPGGAIEPRLAKEHGR